MWFTVLLHAFISSLVYSQYPIVGSEGWLRFPDLWSGQKPCWHERLTRWCRWSTCDIRESMLERLENDSWCKWSDRRFGEWGSAHSNVASPTSPDEPPCLLELIFKSCGEFWWSLEGPVSQLHSPHPHVGAPGIFSHLSRSVQMLKSESGAQSNRTYLSLVKLQPWFPNMQ